MNIKQVRYVCAIVDLGSFSAAAASEGVSVQAVSKAMAELEGALGSPLFERRSAGVTPTPLGRAFEARARRVLEEWDALERFVAAPSSGTVLPGPFRMGFCCPAFPGVEKFCRFISVVAGRVLSREVEVSLTDGVEAPALLRSGRIDGLISIGRIDDDDVVCGSVGTIDSCVLLPKDHPLTRLKELSLDDIADYPVLVSRHFDHFNESVLRAYLARGLRSRLVEVGSLEDLRNFYENEHGVSFMVGGNLLRPEEGFVVRPLVSGDTVAVPICLSTLRGAGGIDYVAFRRSLSKLSLLS